MRKLLPLLVLPGLLATGCGACAAEEDKAAKKRIFSPEDPPRVLLAAREELDATALGEDPTLAARVLRMPGQEAVARLGTHVQRGRTTMRWATEGREIRLEETRSVTVRPGGDFHVLVENDADQGMEWMRLGGVSYSRSRFAPWRERRRDRGSSEDVLASGYATLADFETIAHGALLLRSAGTVSYGSRTAVKYAVSLGSPREAKSTTPLPELSLPKGGPDPDTKLRLEALDKGVPTEVSGRLLVDQATGVPLEADLKLVLVVNGAAGPTRLDLGVVLTVEQIGRDVPLAVPEHLPDEPRPPGVVSTLQSYGYEPVTRERSDGGTPAPGAPEPGDEE